MDSVDQISDCTFRVHLRSPAVRDHFYFFPLVVSEYSWYCNYCQVKNCNFSPFQGNFFARKVEVSVPNFYFSSSSLVGKWMAETRFRADLSRKLWLTRYHIMPHFDALKICIAVENIMRKGEIACSKQFLLFSQCFPPYMALIFHFK